jgi:hypothetical protein
MSEDEIKRRQRELYAELRTLMQKVGRVNKELGDLQRGVCPPQRNDENWVPPFLRTATPRTVVNFRRRKIA